MRRNGDGIRTINIASAEICRVDENRIDDQRTARIVFGYLELDAVIVLEAVGHLHGFFRTRGLLIGDWRSQANFAARRMDDEFAMRVNLKAVCALECEADDGGIDSGGYVEIIFELNLRPVINQVYSIINISFQNLAILRNIDTPPFRVITYKVITLARQFFEGSKIRIGICARDIHPYDCRRLGRAAKRGTAS